MTEESPKKHRYPLGSPHIVRRGNAIFFSINGESWVVGIPQVLKLIKGKNRFHYLNPPPREQERGVTFEEKLKNIFVYKGLRTLSGIAFIVEEKKNEETRKDQ